MAGTDSSKPVRFDPCPAIILCEPQLGENIGAAARAMMNFGLSDLRVVAPRDGWPNVHAQRAASGADRIARRADADPSGPPVAADRTVTAAQHRPRRAQRAAHSGCRAAHDCDQESPGRI